MYQGGVHDIASNWPWKGSPDGHLLLANGIVIGDYMMEIYFDQLSSVLKQDDHDTLPNVGTPQYELKYRAEGKQ